MGGWPDFPTPGELIRLPLSLPPMLCDAVGYTAGGRYVALYWTPFGDELVYSDGTITSTGSWAVWLALREHELGRVILGPYRLGSSETEAEHWLLADRWAHTLDVGLPLDVEQLLRTQPSELAAAVEILGADRSRELLQARLQEQPMPTSEEIHAALAREQQQVAELRRWLDQVLASLEIDAGEG